MEREAARVHLEAQALNKAGKYQEAKAKYDEMTRLENEALRLAAAAQTCASCETELQRQEALLNSPIEQARRWPLYSLAKSAADYDQTLEPVPFAETEARRRAAAAVCGAYVADCASVGVQWIYDTAVLEELLEKKRRAEGGDDKDVGLEFFDPVASPFLAADYRTGRPSPYGEETLVLIRALAAEEEKPGSLHCGRYAERYSLAFGGAEGGAAGGKGGADAPASSSSPSPSFPPSQPPPFKGYMNASTRGFLRNYAASGLRPPWSGADDKQADCVARVAPLVAAFGGGSCWSLSSSSSLERATEMATRTTQNDDEAVAWACAAALVLRKVCLGERIEDAARAVVGELKEQGGDDGARRSLPMAPEVAREVAARLEDALSRLDDSPEQAVAALGRNCHLPNSYQTPLHAAMWGERLAEASGGVDARGAFVAAIRGALRGGGCCASRAQTAGALLAARLGEEAIPLDWREKCWDWQEVESAAARIAGC